MFEEQSTTEAVKRPEAPETHEAPRSVESPEELRQVMLSESEGEVDGFKKEGTEDLVQVESRAATEGLVIDNEDSAALLGLNQEADGARAELAVEIQGEPEKRSTPPPIPDVGKIWSPDSKFPPPLPVESRAIPPPLPQEHRTTPPPLPPEHRAIPPPLPFEKSLATKERVIENPDLLSAKEASKKFLVEERKKLAEEIRVQRKAQRERLLALKNATESAAISTESMDGEQEDEQYGQLIESQSAEANELAKRVSSSELSDQDAQDEQNNISQLIQNSENVKAFKAKLEEHYAKADAIARERFDTLNRSLEHVMQRNNIFLVHKLEEKEGDGFRHDENYSNVSTRTTYEDDIDILLSLEPSISASSAIPGEKTKLWHGASGLLLGGGHISEAGSSDIRTLAHGIKDRRSEDGEIASIEKIDSVVSKKGNEYMNELVINNPEIFGFFQHAEKDEKGRLWAVDRKTRGYAEERPGFSNRVDPLKLQSVVEDYQKRFAVARERGIPLYIMTENREVYEYMGVNADGTVEIGKQITPEEVAKGRAGLPPEKRKEIGEKLVEKRIFRKQETQEEAREIISSL